MIPVHPDSRKYTTFVTEQGMFRYLRMPMGDHVSMDAYNFRFDKVTEKVENLKRCEDDSLFTLKPLRKPSLKQQNIYRSWGRMASFKIRINFSLGLRQLSGQGSR